VDVGTYDVTCGDASDPDAIISYAGGGLSTTTTSSNTPSQLVINPAPLTVTANNVTVNYGTDYTLGATYSGLVNGDTMADEAADTTCLAGLPAPVNPGSYPIVCSDSDPDYTQTDINGTLTINKAPLTVTAKSVSMTYGDTFPTLSASFTGLVGGDTQTSENAKTTCSAGTPAPVHPGTYTISCSTTDSHYTQTDVNGTLTINKAPLTVTANNESMTYGGTYPTFSATFSGLVNGDTTTTEGAQTTCTSVPATSGVGSYPINCTDSDSDYAPTYVAGTFTINPAPLTITAPTLTADYGAVPTFSPKYTGLVNGDTAPTTPATCSSSATDASVPGHYAVKCSGAVDPNYVFTYVAGILTIVPAPTSFKVTQVLTKNKGQTTAVLGETGLPSGAEGFVTFQGTANGCTIFLTGAPGEATTCSVNYGATNPPIISGSFYDTDGNYLSSSSTNEV
jgi:hypothetical protein